MEPKSKTKRNYLRLLLTILFPSPLPGGHQQVLSPLVPSGLAFLTLKQQKIKKMALDNRRTDCWNSSNAYYRLTERALSGASHHVRFSVVHLQFAQKSQSPFICTQRDCLTLEVLHHQLHNGTTLGGHPVGHYETSLQQGEVQFPTRKEMCFNG